MRHAFKTTQRVPALDSKAFARFCSTARERELFDNAVNKRGIKLVELLPDTPEEVKNQAKRLYYSAFPNKAERDDWASLERLVRLRLGQDGPDRPLFHHVALMSGNDVIGYTAFNTLHVDSGSVAVIGWYGSIADARYMKRVYGRKEDFRNGGLEAAFYPITHGIASSDAPGKSVIGTMIESEMIGQGRKRFDIWFTRARLRIHQMNGELPVMLEMEGGGLVTPWMQPSLGAGRDPYLLHLLYRPAGVNGPGSYGTSAVSVLDKERARGLLLALANSFTAMGYDAEATVRLVNERLDRAKRVLLVPSRKMPDITRLAEHDGLLAAQARREYGSLGKHARRIADVLKNGPQGALGKWLAIMARGFNPKTICKKAREDIRALKEARSTRDADIAGKPDVIAAKVDMKLAAAVAASEFIGTYIGALPAGITVQELTKNAYWGVLGTILGDYLPAVLSFQAAWLALNIGYYKNSAKTFWGRIKHFYQDVLPLHLAAAVAAVPAYAAGAALSSGLIALINCFFPHGAEKIHVMPLISEIINFGIVEAIYLAVVASQAANYAKGITARYTSYLEKKFGNKG